MNTEQLIELFVDGYENCELGSKIAIHNTYVRANVGLCENEIESNDEDFFNKYYEDSPMEAVRAALCGDYRLNDDWVWIAENNLVSGDTEEQLPLTDTNKMAEWFIKNYEEIEYITEMGEFCYECEQTN